MRIGACALGLLASVSLSLPSAAAAAATLPAGFSDDPVVSVGSPTDLAFTPDGRMLITTQPGRLRVVADGALLPTAALDLVAAGTVCSNSERGLLGVAVDPDFTANGYIYLFHTFKNVRRVRCEHVAGSCPPRLALHAVAAAGEHRRSGERTRAHRQHPLPAGYHNAGDLAIAADGLLYVTVGDGSCRLSDPSMCAAQNDNARYLDTPPRQGAARRPRRIDPEWQPVRPNATDARRCGDPAGVPGGNGPCSETFASGLRNPFRFAFRPGTSEFLHQRRRPGGVGGDRPGDRGGPTTAGTSARASAPPARPPTAGARRRA